MKCLVVDKSVKSAYMNRKNPLLRRSRFWIDSMILGSEITLREHATLIWGEERAGRKQFGRAFGNSGNEVWSMRQLAVDVN